AASTPAGPTASTVAITSSVAGLATRSSDGSWGSDGARSSDGAWGSDDSWDTVRASHAFEGAAQFPVGDRGVEGVHLDARHVQVVGDDVGAEGVLGEGAGLPQFGGLAQGGGDVFVVGGVGVAGAGVGQLKSLLDAVQSGGDHARHGEVRVDVAAGEAVLEAQGGAVAHHAQRAGAVVAPPGDGGRGEGAGLEPLVGVDVGGV